MTRFQYFLLMILAINAMVMMGFVEWWMAVIFILSMLIDSIVNNNK